MGTKSEAEAIARLKGMTLLRQEELLQKEIAEETIYKEWIENCQKSGREIPDFIKINTTVAALRKMTEEDILLENFPINLEQVEALGLCKIKIEKVLVFDDEILQSFNFEERQALYDAVEFMKKSGIKICHDMK